MIFSKKLSKIIPKNQQRPLLVWQSYTHGVSYAIFILHYFKCIKPNQFPRLQKKMRYNSAFRVNANM